MIKLDVKGRLECDEPGCRESVSVRLVLLANGTFGPDITADLAKKWELFIDGKNRLQPYVGRCEFHRLKKPQLTTRITV